MSDVWAVVPVKELAQAKQRLAARLAPALRRALALAMLEDVLAALAKAPALAGIAVLSVDPDVAALAARFGAAQWPEDARAGHSEAVAAAARRLAGQGCAMLTVPADIPLLAAEDIGRLIAAAKVPPAFVIVPARDGCGSNAVLCAPADCVGLRFGGESFAAHLAAAHAGGIVPVVLDLPRVALDLDAGADLDLFLAYRSDTRAQAVLERHGVAAVRA
jgi:2-phospho-L-lactate/phosphoenolpyruvate guanylyltransferase